MDYTNIERLIECASYDSYDETRSSNRENYNREYNAYISQYND